MATITSTATGDWSVGATWVGGVKPASGDDAVIDTGHVVTKDDAKAANDCAALLVTGQLNIGDSTGLQSGGNISGAGTIQMRGACELELNAHSSSQTLVWDVQGTDASNLCTLTLNNTTLRIDGTNGQPTFTFALIDNPFYFEFKSVKSDAVFEDTEFYNTHYSYWHNKPFGFTLSRCFIADWDANRFYSVADGMIVIYKDCVFGKRRGGSAANNSYDAGCHANSGGVREVFLNCQFNSPTRANVGNASYVGSSQGENNVEGDWRIDRYGGYVLRSTASKKTGDYGIEFVPSANCSASNPIYIDIPIPVDTGDVLTGPSIWVYNATADLDLQAAADRMVFELDPGDEWGLNETIDANTLADVYLNWRQVTFSSGTAGGTAKKGTVMLRVWLKRYIASAVVYLADLAY